MTSYWLKTERSKIAMSKQKLVGRGKRNRCLVRIPRDPKGEHTVGGNSKIFPNSDFWVRLSTFSAENTFKIKLSRQKTVLKNIVNNS